MDHRGAGDEPLLAEHVYQMLLLAYPRAFREEYAAEMLLTFRDAYRDASRRYGAWGVLQLWCDVLADFVKSVGIEHAHSWRQQGERELAWCTQSQVALALPFMLHVAQHTDIGRLRASNEDSLVSLVPDDGCLLRARGALFVVADGMGGPGRGDVASELTIRHVTDAYYGDLQADIPAALRRAVWQANDAIRQASKAERLEGAGDLDMGATCVAAVLHERTLYVANVGDSRAYVLHAGQLRQVTRDHSLVAQLVARGELTPAEARAHPQRSLIYRALGLPGAEADLFVEPVEDGDTLVLCTDGLCGVIEDEELRAIVAHDAPEESVQRLIACANARGGPDNVSAVVVRVSKRVYKRV